MLDTPTLQAYTVDLNTGVLGNCRPDTIFNFTEINQQFRN